MVDRIVITGMGIVSAAGPDRESTWGAVCRGESAVRSVVGLEGIPDGLVLAAMTPGRRRGWEQHNMPLARAAAAEAIADARLAQAGISPERFAVVGVANFGNTPRLADLRAGIRLAGEEAPWWEELLPSTTTSFLANELRAYGPRISYSAACASSTLSLIGAARLLRLGECDAVIVGAAETIHPLMAAGFHNMRVLGSHSDPKQACRPFDSERNGFVMGEGSAMMILERAEDAVAREARIYAELVGGACCGDAHHVTDLNTDTAGLEYVLRQALRSGGLAPSDIAYINAHGTGTLQNDVTETRAIRQVFGQAASSLCVSSVKACVGHLVNAAGAMELALTVLALRDGFAPPTINLTTPDPECDLDCIPLVGRHGPWEHAVKISVAFGGHLAALALRRWSEACSRPAALPRLVAAAA
jgi:3-oxoacyl-(acyl-carrier-protein) synthase